MSFFPKKAKIVGIEVTSSSFKLAFLIKKRGRWQISRCEEVPLNCQALDMIPSDTTIVTALSEQQVLVRSMQLSVKKRSLTDSLIAFQAEPMLPYTLEKAVLQKVVTKAKNDSTEITLFSIKKEHLNEHLSLFSAKNVESEVVTTSSCALAALQGHIEEAKNPTLLMHLGENEGTLALCENGNLLAARSFENDKYEMQKSVLALTSMYKAKSPDTIYLFAEEEISAKIVRESTGKEVAIPSLAKNYKGFSLAIGIAYAYTQKQCPNFRQKEFVYPHRWKKIRKPLVSYFAAASLLLFALFFLEKKMLQEREDLILENASTLTSKASSKAELYEKLAHIEKQMQQTHDTFALLPTLPKVSDLLASLTKDSQFVNIEELRYQLVQRPTFDAREKHYLVKVTLLLSATSPKWAHLFHEHLKSSHPFVDAQQEISWEMAGDQYRTSFYLKDKTRYN